VCLSFVMRLPPSSRPPQLLCDFLCRDVNVDNNTVGWYHSTYLGSHITEELISTQFNYQESIPKCVCLIFDPMKTAQGNLALKAVRLTDSFLALYKGGEFTLDRCQPALPLRLDNAIFMGIFHVHSCVAAF
jgi:hypothetical protein